MHCNYGMSRSPSVVIAYLMRSDEGLSLAGALRMVKQMRPVVAPAKRLRKRQKLWMASPFSSSLTASLKFLSHAF